jgi:hypothetical protein
VSGADFEMPAAFWVAGQEVRAEEIERAGMGRPNELRNENAADVTSHVFGLVVDLVEGLFER